MTTKYHDVDELLAEMRVIGDTSPPPAPNAALLAAFEDRSTQCVVSGAYVIPKRRTPRGGGAGRRRWLRPIVMPATLGAVLFGGLAAAGALPAPLQHATASVVAHLGVSLPGRTTPASPPVQHNPAPGRRAHTGTTTPAHRASSPTALTTHTRKPASPPATSAPSTPSASTPQPHGGGLSPLTLPKLVPPTIPTVTLPTVPLPTVPNLPPVTLPALP